MSPALRVIRPHEVVPDLDTWVLTEEHVPESSPHEILSERIKHLLIGWAERNGRSTKIGRNLAVRWDQKRPQLGLDPDVYVVEPPPPEGARACAEQLDDASEYDLQRPFAFSSGYRVPGNWVVRFYGQPPKMRILNGFEIEINAARRCRIRPLR